MILSIAKVGDNVKDFDKDFDDIESDLKKISPFDIVTNISSSNQQLQKDQIENMMYISIQGLSYNPDTVLISQFFNRPNIPDYLKYLALFHSVPKRNRYTKWPKKSTSDETLLLVKKYYNISNKEAGMYAKLLNESDIDQIRNIMAIGGLSKKTNTKPNSKAKVKPDDSMELLDDTVKHKPKLQKSDPISNNSMEQFFK